MLCSDHLPLLPDLPIDSPDSSLDLLRGGHDCFDCSTLLLLLGVSPCWDKRLSACFFYNMKHKIDILKKITLKCPSEKCYRLCPRGGDPPLKTIFPVEFIHTNCTIGRGHKT